MAPSSIRNPVLGDLVSQVSSDKALVQLLAQSYDPATRDEFARSLRSLLSPEGRRAVKNPWEGFMTHCAENIEDIPLLLVVALKKRKAAQKPYKHRRTHFADEIGLSPKTKGSKLAGIPTIWLNKLKKEYPPQGHDIYETGEAQEIWAKHRETATFPDKRGTWKPFHELDPTHLQHVVRGDQSAILRDPKTNELIGLVIREFTGKAKLLDWINGIIMENNTVRKSIRLEDPGKLCQIGYTAGSRSDQQLGWARNLLWKQTEVEENRLMYESSSVFALFWNILQNQLPGDVMTTFEEWLQEKQMVRMDTLGSQDVAKGMYTVGCGDETYEFHGVEMPPPSGVFGTNYTRFIHREGSPHKYAVAWTTMREPELDATAGGHFFICNYGVKVEAAADSVVVWNPKSWHGTSLQRREPSDPGIFQAGLAIVTPTGINNLWQEVLDEKISLEEARKKVLDLETEELDI